MGEFIMSVITHPAFNIAVGLIGFLIGNFFAIGRDKRNEFIAAADEFRRVFNQHLVDIQSRRYGFGDAISEKIIEAHRLAYFNFRPYLRGEYLRQYNEAWEKYCHCCENLARTSIFIRTTHKDLEKDVKHLLTLTEYSFRRNVVSYWSRKARSVWLKIFGPSKKEKESTKKLIKLYEDYYHDKKPLP